MSLQHKNYIKITLFDSDISPSSLNDPPPYKIKIKFNGKEVKQVEKMVYILLNKPIGYVTTAKDQFDRPIVLDLVKNCDAGRINYYICNRYFLDGI